MCLLVKLVPSAVLRKSAKALPPILPSLPFYGISWLHSLGLALNLVAGGSS